MYLPEDLGANSIFLYFFVLLIVSLTMLSIVLGCVCGCRKPKSNDESRLGKEGKIRQLDAVVSENDNLLPVNDSVSKRASSLKRSLPDIPKNDVRNWEPQDNCSELYATVGDSPYAEPSVATAGTHSNGLRASQKQNRTSLAESQDDSAADEQPVAPPRSRRSSHSNSSQHISAAPAIIGQVSASQELPYITLPLPESRFQHEAEGAVASDNADLAANVNCSGDSQDSSKGYTSISVREPLSNIQCSTQETSPERRKFDPPYDTVSNDSDEMYAAIEDSNESSKRMQHRAEAGAAGEGPSVAVSSPKLEKRQANSPLPPTPLKSQDAMLEDMYAKVVKKSNKKDKRKSKEVQASNPVNYSEGIAGPNYEEVKSAGTAGPNYEELKAAQNLASPNYEEVKSGKPGPNYEELKSADDSATSPNYEEVKSVKRNLGPNYEEVKSTPATDFAGPNYEEVKSVDPNYEVVKETVVDDPNYECVSEPPYEKLCSRRKPD